MIYALVPIVPGPVLSHADYLEPKESYADIAAHLYACDASVQDGMWFDGLTFGWYVAPLADAIKAAVLKIDADADAIRGLVLGERTTEYQSALKDAQDFQAAGFTGTVPVNVQNWLDAKTAAGAGWTAQQAAQDILDTAAAWSSAQDAIRANRLLRKEMCKVAVTQAALDTQLAHWTGFVSAVRTQLGLPQG